MEDEKLKIKQLYEIIHNLEFENNVLRVKNEYMLKNIYELKNEKKTRILERVYSKIKNKLNKG